MVTLFGHMVGEEQNGSMLKKVWGKSKRHSVKKQVCKTLPRSKATACEGMIEKRGRVRLAGLPH